ALGQNPAVDVRAPKTAKHLPHTLDTDQMASLLEFQGDDAWSTRDKAMLELFYSSGLRLQELVSLNVSDLDLSDRTVRVTGKGNKMRIVPVGRHAITALHAWLRERGAIHAGARNEVDGMSHAKDDAALFVGRQGRRLGSRAVQKRV